MDQEKDLQELTAEELVEEISEEIVEPSVEDAAPAKHEKAKTPIWAIVVIAVLALALIATAAFAFIRLRPEAGSETIAVEPHHINAHGYPSCCSGHCNFIKLVLLRTCGVEHLFLPTKVCVWNNTVLLTPLPNWKSAGTASFYPLGPYFKIVLTAYGL